MSNDEYNKGIQFITELEKALNEGFKEKEDESSKFVDNLKKSLKSFLQKAPPPDPTIFPNKLITKLTDVMKASKTKNVNVPTATSSSQTSPITEPSDRSSIGSQQSGSMSSITSSDSSFLPSTSSRKQCHETSNDVPSDDIGSDNFSNRLSNMLGFDSDTASTVSDLTSDESFNNIFHDTKNTTMNKTDIKKRLTEIDELLKKMCYLEIKIDGKSDFFDIYGKKNIECNGNTSNMSELETSSDIDFDDILEMSEEERDQYIQLFIKKINSNPKFKNIIVEILELLKQKLSSIKSKSNKDKDLNILEDVIQKILEKIIKKS